MQADELALLGRSPRATLSMCDRLQRSAPERPRAKALSGRSRPWSGLGLAVFDLARGWSSAGGLPALSASASDILMQAFLARSSLATHRTTTYSGGRAPSR